MSAQPMNVVTGMNNWLACPHCQGLYLHHQVVNIYDRDAEDADLGTHVVSSGRSASITTGASMDCCPSTRRGGLTIEFWCEGCGSRPVLTLAQHKGNTRLEWKAHE